MLIALQDWCFILPKLNRMLPKCSVGVKLVRCSRVRSWLQVLVTHNAVFAYPLSKLLMLSRSMVANSTVVVADYM